MATDDEQLAALQSIARSTRLIWRFLLVYFILLPIATGVVTAAVVARHDAAILKQARRTATPLNQRYSSFQECIDSGEADATPTSCGDAFP